MNETANATLALGALPVMAHAREEVEEMVGLAGALVLNIGTLSPHWVEAMLLAGRAANERGVPVVLDPVGAGATRYRTETAKRILDEVDVTVLRGNAGEVATLVGVEAEVRGVESIAGGGDPAALAREAARALGVVASVTGPVDHVSDGDARARDRERPSAARVDHRHRLHVERDHRLLPRRRRRRRSSGAAEALVAFGVAGEDAAVGAKGPGSFHVALYDALAALDPDDARRAGEGRREGSRDRRRPRDGASRGRRPGATVVQLRVKAPTAEVVARGRGFGDARRDLRRERRRRRGARARRRRRAPRPVRPGRRAGARGGPAARPLGGHLRAGASRRTPTTSASGRSGRRRRRTTPTRRSASTSSRASARAVSVPVVAIGGIDASNAAACIRAGAAGVAVDPRGDGSRAAAGGR